MTDEQGTTEQPRRAALLGRQIDRRKFLKAMGVVVAAPALSSALESSPASATRLAAASGSGGGTLVYAMEIANIPPLDPQTALAEGSSLQQAVQPMFEGLVMDNYYTVGGQAPFGQPHLAESWTLLDGGKTWEWHLRPNVKFHDGSAWDADAAIWNFQRMYAPKSPQYYAEAAGLIATYMPGPILSMAKVDDVTFRMTLPIARPLNEELGWIWMVSPTAVEKHGNAGFGTNPVGTGGMKFSRLVAGQQFEMVRNPDYWGKPFALEKIIVRPIPDATARADALITGSINMAVELDPVTLSPLKRAGDKVAISPRIHTWDVIFNTQTSPFKNKVVRQALNYAIDRNAIANDILKGTATPMQQFVSPGSKWYDPSIPPYTYNPDKAQAMLASAGYPHGFTSHWLAPINGSGMLTPVPIMEIVQANLSAIGVTINLTTYEWADYLSIFFKGFPDGVDAMAISYGPQWTYWWGLMFAPEYLPPNGVLNPGRYTNHAITPLYNKALALAGPNPTESAMYVRQLEKIVWEDAPWLFVVHGDNVRGTTPNVHGLVPTEGWLFGWQPISMT
jgi:peptide/nickel transport system substrate-binding protein